MALKKNWNSIEGKLVKNLILLVNVQKQIASSFVLQWEQDSDEEELLELPESWTEKDEDAEEYWVSDPKTGVVEFKGKTYIKELYD